MNRLRMNYSLLSYLRERYINKTAREGERERDGERQTDKLSIFCYYQ